MTLVRYDDDLKVSHESSFEITKFALYLEDVYDGLTVHRGTVHNYLGMDLNFSEDGEVKVLIIKYINSILREFPEYLGEIATSPVADHMFKVSAEREA